MNVRAQSPCTPVHVAGRILTRLVRDEDHNVITPLEIEGAPVNSAGRRCRVLTAFAPHLERSVTCRDHVRGGCHCCSHPCCQNLALLGGGEAKGV